MSYITDGQQATNSQSQSTDPNNYRYAVDTLPPIFQTVFSSSFKYFNEIQTKLFDLLVHEDKSLGNICSTFCSVYYYNIWDLFLFTAICAPTGSGKTALLEMAIVRELMKMDCGLSSQASFKDIHILYLAPLKAIVDEKCKEWQKKFSPFGLKCFSLTGDTEFDDYSSAQVSSYTNINIILATPEKFDHVIRTDPRSRMLLAVLKLILIDEVHMLSDSHRGIVYLYI